MGEYYRLTDQVVPQHYDLYLEPDLENCTFKGRVEIDLIVQSSQDELAVNAHNFNKLTVTRLVKLGSGTTDETKQGDSTDTKRAERTWKFDENTGNDNTTIRKRERLAAKISNILAKSPEQDNVKRKRDEDNQPIFAKRSKPCPGRFRNRSSSDESEREISPPDGEDQDEKDSSSPRKHTDEKDSSSDNENDSDGDDLDKATARLQSRDIKERSADVGSSRDTKEGSAVASSSRDHKEEKEDIGNDNVKTGSGGGLLLLRSEWTGPDEDSTDEDEYARQRFVESDEESEENDDDERSDYDSRDNDEGGYVLSSDDDDDRDDDDQRDDDDVCYVRDEDSDDDVMQVDGAADSSDEDDPVDIVGEGDGISSENPAENESNKNVPETDEKHKEDKDTLNLQLESDQEDAGVQEELKKTKEDQAEEAQKSNDDKKGDEKDVVIDTDEKEKLENSKQEKADDKEMVRNAEKETEAESEAEIEPSDDARPELDEPSADVEPAATEEPSVDAEPEPEEPAVIEDLEIEIRKQVFLEEKQVLVIHPEDLLEPGHYKLEIEFSGVLDDSLRGFYRTKHNVNGEAKWGAACHFEATGARKCFPCIDQPEFRSTFDIAVKRPNKQVEVLSNMPSEGEDEGGVIKFARTPAMPTYLICLVIGYYDSISRRSDCGVKISAFAQTGQALQAQYALDVATRALKFYQDFFGVAYTLPKMDLVAVPDFYIGAMENWGLLTFRETALLFHPGHSTLSRRQYVAILVCHEIAHQWFGNLVSVAWWDQIWLKEGFATWISFLAVDNLFPEFDIWSDFLTSEQLKALQLDCLDSSHSIQVEVQDPGQIDEIFDTISYNKGASIIHMLFHWIGEKAFKAGMNMYLTKHGGTSASTEDLWSSLDAARDNMARRTSDAHSVAHVMNEWTTVKGYPTLDVSKRDGRYVIRQSSRHDYTWKLPIKAFNSDVAVVLDKEEHEFNIEVAGFPLINVGQAAYCRVHYDWETVMQDHLSDIHNLAPRDKAGILMNLFLDFMRSEERMDHMFDLLRCYSGETDWVVVDALMNVLDIVESLVRDTKAWTGYLQLTYSLLTSILDKVGWNPDGLRGNLSLTQGAVINRLGVLGHADTCGEATLIWRREERGGPAVSNSIRAAVYKTVAAHGGRRELTYFMNMYRKVERNEEKRMLLTVLGSFNNTELMKEVLDWCMTDEVKLQDRVFVFGCISTTGLEGRSLVFKFFQDNFDTLSQQYTSGSLLKRLITGVIINFNTSHDLEKIKNFFQKHEVPGAQRTIEQCCEDIQLLVNARQRYQSDILEYFSRHARAELEVRG